MPTYYRHTDKHLRLIMQVVALCCTLQSRLRRESVEGQIDRWIDYQVHYLPTLLR